MTVNKGNLTEATSSVLTITSGSNAVLGTGTTIQFTDTSINNPTTWHKTFGDGNTSIARNPAHTYTSLGSYVVTLTASNQNGVSSPASQVIGASAPGFVAAFSATPPTSGLAPLTVQFMTSQLELAH